MLPFHKRHERKEDGRQLSIYGTRVHTLPWQNSLPPLRFQPSPHLRWHPFRQEWVCYAAHRQERTFKPPAAYCPFCPTQKNSFPTEIPFSDFEVAVFDNRFPAFHLKAQNAPELSIQTTPAIGQCEISVRGKFEAFSANYQQRAERGFDTRSQDHWSDYLLACLQQLKKRPIDLLSVE